MSALHDLSAFFSANSVTANIMWITAAIILLYVARTPAHRAIRLFAVLFRNGLRLAATSIMIAENRIRQRNRQVMLAAGRDLQERFLEREFQRVHAIVRRDLEGYPALNRVLREQLLQIEEDYNKSIDVPPLPPAWLDAIHSIAKIPANEHSPVADILADLNATLERNHKDAMTTYRKACRQRHGLLRRMVPYWRRLANTLSSVDRKITDLDGRIPAIDAQMQKYEQILAGTERAERELSASFMTQFFVSGVVLMVAIMGGIINFHLIALPMSEMVGGGSYLGPVRTADVAALVIILVEIAMGIFLMESLRITRMFPAIHVMDDQMRRRMVWVTLTILVMLASVESALAYMRDLLSADKEALTRALSGTGEAAAAQYRWIASVGQMLLGFVLPFALTCVAIPMESFIQATRVVFGSVVSATLRMMVFGLRWIGALSTSIGSILTQFYDVLIFFPLWLERLVKERRAARTENVELPILNQTAPRRAAPDGAGLARFQSTFSTAGSDSPAAASGRSSAAANATASATNGAHAVSRVRPSPRTSPAPSASSSSHTPVDPNRHAQPSGQAEPNRQAKPSRLANIEVTKKSAPGERRPSTREDNRFGVSESSPTPQFQ